MSHETEVEALIEVATWALIDYDTDVADRGVRDEHYRERRADVERVLPILSRTAQPVQVEVTNDMVERALIALMRSEDVPTGVRPHLVEGEVLVIRERCDAEPIVRAALAAALGGGE